MTIKSSLVIPSVVAISSENGGNKLENRIIIKSDVIPEASSATFGKFYCYSGETTSAYTHGYIYECKAEATYDPIIGIYPTKIGFDYTKGNLVEFWQQATPNFEAIDHGIFEYDIEGDIWLISAVDKYNNTILPDNWDDLDGFKLYTQDLEDAGFVMLHPMEDYADGEQLEYEIDWHATYNNFYWERINVQPGGGSVKFVPELPAQGEPQYIYGVVLEETTRQGYGIIQLFMWYNDNWYAAGAFDVDIDPSQLVYRNNIPYATSTLVGGIKQTFDATTGTWTVITEDL